MKKAIVYARYSSDRQTEQSIEGQVHVCQDFAEREDYLIVDYYIDRATTGTNDNREAFQRMIRDSHDKKWDYIIVYKLDRFSRNRYDSIVNKRILKKNGIKLISATEPISEQPEGIILESLLEGMAEYYSAELSQKVKRGMAESRRKGNFTGGAVPYGYDVVNKKYVVNKEEAVVVKRIFKEYLNGKGLKEIAENLAKEGLKTKQGKIFNNKHVFKIIHNQNYIGKHTILGVEYTNMFPPIIDEFTYNDTILKINANKYKNGIYKADEIYVLSGKVICGECGHTVTGSTGTSSHEGIKHKYYKCLNRIKKSTNCKLKTFRKSELEDYISNLIIGRLSDEKVFNSIVKNTVALYNEEINKTFEIGPLKANLNEINKKINNLTEAITNGIYNEATQEMMTKLINERKIILENIAIQEAIKKKPITEETVTSFLNQFTQFKSENLTLMQKRRLFDIFLAKAIVYDDGRIILVCNSLDSLQRKNEPFNSKKFVSVTNGGGSGIRTLARLTSPSGFQDRSLQPLG